jgi:hypothetical protein
MNFRGSGKSDAVSRQPQITAKVRLPLTGVTMWRMRIAMLVQGSQGSEINFILNIYAQIKSMWLSPSLSVQNYCRRVA